MDHEWPAELTSDAECGNCGLTYDEWDDDDPGCPGHVE